MPNDAANRCALVLSGGGAYGAYEVGVIQALFEGRSPSTSGTPLDPDVFAGTSVGGFNAAVLAMNEGGAPGSCKRLAAIWTDRIADHGDGRGNGVYRIHEKLANYFDPGATDKAHRRAAAFHLLSGFLLPEERLIERMRAPIDIDAFLKGEPLLDCEPLHRLVQDSIRPGAIRNSGKILSVTATGWWTGDAREFDFPNMTDEDTWAAIRASAAIPGFFPPVKLWNEVFVDGGVVQNTPIRPAIDKGATEIHVVSLNPRMPQLTEGHVDNLLDTFGRVYTEMLNLNITGDIEWARGINEGLEVLERVDAGEDVGNQTMQRFARAAEVISRKLRKDGELPRALTVHRYYPGRSLGGLPGMLNFQRAPVEAMIDAGYADTCAHDCKVNHCVVPGAGQSSQPRC